MPTTQRDTLSPDQERILRDVAQNADPSISRRAILILRWSEGVAISQIAKEIGMSVSGVNHWLKQFRERGTDLFESAAIAVPEPEPEIVVPEPEPEPEIVEAAPLEARPRRGRPPKKVVAVEIETIVDSLPEPTSEMIAPEPIAPSESESEAIEPELEMPPAKKPRAKPGRRPKAAEPVVIAEVVEPEIVFPEAEPHEPLVAEPVIEPPAPPPVLDSVTVLVNYYGVNLKHARRVTELAFALFDATAEVHRLPDSTRALLEAGALLHNVAYELDPAEHHTRGRDIILDTPLKHFNADERRMIALLVVFHRKRVRPEREPEYLRLPLELRGDTLALAAILRLADGCDGSLSQTTQIVDVQPHQGELLILLSGPDAEADVGHVKEKADLWERLFGQSVRVSVRHETATNDQTAPTEAAAVRLPGSSHTHPDHMPDLVMTLDPAMSGGRAMRKLAMHFTDRLDRLATQVRGGDSSRLPALAREIDRVAGLLPLAAVERFENDLRWLARTTEAASMAATLYDRALALSDDSEDANAPLIGFGLDGWRAAAEAALERLDFARYDHLLGDLRRELVGEPAHDSGALISTLVGPVVWTQLTELRDVMERGESVVDALTAARRLQDYLLYFRSLLGSEAVQALDMLFPFESYLAAIHLVQSLLTALDSPEPAAQALHKAQLSILDELADGLPPAWSAINSPVFRRALALALATP